MNDGTRRDGIEDAMLAIMDAIKADAMIRDPGEFADGTGFRDPFEKGIAAGMTLALGTVRRLLDET